MWRRQPRVSDIISTRADRFPSDLVMGCFYQGDYPGFGEHEQHVPQVPRRRTTAGLFHHSCKRCSRQFNEYVAVCLYMMSRARGQVRTVVQSLSWPSRLPPRSSLFFVVAQSVACWIHVLIVCVGMRFGANEPPMNLNSELCLHFA
jgi:hypothetical protein